MGGYRRPRAPAYEPSSYYVGTDWLRVIAGGLASLILIVSIAGLGYYLFDRFEPTNDETSLADATSTPTIEVEVFLCAGDADFVRRQLPPQADLIGGRNAAGTWLAFRNQQPPPRQLWIVADDLPSFDPSSVGIVSCATSPNEFPTPGVGPTAGPSPPATPDPDITPTPDPDRSTNPDSAPGRDSDATTDGHPSTHTHASTASADRAATHIPTAADQPARRRLIDTARPRSTVPERPPRSRLPAMPSLRGAFGATGNSAGFQALWQR